MKVPKEIRDIPRPDHTVVEPYRSGKFAIRTRIDRFDEKGNLTFRRGQVIGYISDGCYRESRQEKRLKSIGTIDSKQYGAVVLLDSLCKDILDDLCRIYDFLDAEWIYCVALIRASDPGVKDCKLEPKYKHSFVSELHPNVAMNKDKVTEMFTLLGEQFRKCEEFMISRLGEISEDDLVVIDGCLKEDNGNGLSISKASRKTFQTKTFHHMMMYAYSPMEGEPLCSKIYPGNVPDKVAVSDFVKSLQIFKGLIVADRGFRPDVMMKVSEEHEELHYLVPLTKNLKVVDDSNALAFDSVIQGDDGPISCKRCRAVDKNKRELGFWLYAFKNPDVAAKTEREYLENHADKLDPILFAAEREWFGVRVLQSDMKMELQFAFDAYDDRWGIEPLFKLQKSGLDIDSTNEKSDEMATGSEFVNFIATLMAARLRNHLMKIEVCRNLSYKGILSDLRDCVKVRTKNGEWEYRTTTAKDMEFYVKVGAVTEPEMVEAFGEKPVQVVTDGPRKRGRPKGSKDSSPRKRRTRAEMKADEIAKST